MYLEYPINFASVYLFFVWLKSIFQFSQLEYYCQCSVFPVRFWLIHLLFRSQLYLCKMVSKLLLFWSHLIVTYIVPIVVSICLSCSGWLLHLFLIDVSLDSESVRMTKCGGRTYKVNIILLICLVHFVTRNKNNRSYIEQII